MGREFALQIPQLYKNLDELWVVARRTDRLKSLKEQVKIPVRIFDGDMQRDYIFEKLQRELDRRQADVRMLVNAAGYGKIGNVSDIDLKEQCGMVDLNCTALTRMTADTLGDEEVTDFKSFSEHLSEYHGITAKNIYGNVVEYSSDSIKSITSDEIQSYSKKSCSYDMDNLETAFSLNRELWI